MIGLTLVGGAGCDEGGGAKISSSGGTSAVPVGGAAPNARPGDEMMAAVTKAFPHDDFEQMIYVLKLTDRAPAAIDPNKPPQMSAAEKAFRANMDARSKKLAEYRASAEAKKAGEANAEVRAEKDPAKKADLEKKNAAVIKADRTKMQDLRRMVMGPLSADQKAYWAQYACYRGPSSRFRTANLTAEQKDKLWAMCADCSKKLVAANYVNTDPYLTSDATKTVVADCVAAAWKKVLTDEQKKVVPDPAAPRDAAPKAAAPKAAAPKAAAPKAAAPKATK
jgi:histone H1/5